MLPRRLSTGTAYAPTGSLNQQITLLERSTQRDALGNFIDPGTFATCWARIEPLASKYTQDQQQIVTEATHRITIRYIPNVTTALTIQLSSGAIWNIESVLDPDGRQFELWLMAYERNDGQS